MLSISTCILAIVYLICIIKIYNLQEITLRCNQCVKCTIVDIHYKNKLVMPVLQYRYNDRDYTTDHVTWIKDKDYRVGGEHVGLIDKNNPTCIYLKHSKSNNTIKKYAVVNIVLAISIVSLLVIQLTLE